MTYLLSVFWAWLLLALASGAIVGWVTWGASDKPRFGGWVPYGILALVVAVAVALLRLLAEAPALWLETALLFASSYLIGCCLGSLLRASRRTVDDIAPITVGATSSSSIEATHIALPVGEVATRAVDEPETSPPVADEEKHAGKRPKGLVSPRGGRADDLKLVRGIGPQNEGRLHALGIWHFAQIAGWTSDEVNWVGSYLAFPGRIEREDWRGQARQLAGGSQTDFAKRAARGEVASSRDDGTQGQGNVAKLAKPRKNRNSKKE